MAQKAKGTGKGKGTAVPSPMTPKKIALAAGALALAVGLFFALWALFAPKPLKMDYDPGRGGYYDAKNDILYHFAPICYEPVKVQIKHPYGKSGKDLLYPLTGAEPTVWLGERYTGGGGIYYAEGTPLPALDEFDAEAVSICEQTDTYVRQIRLVDRKDHVRAIADAMENGTAASFPMEYYADYHLKFSSGTYTWLYYDIVYIEGKDDNFLYDRARQKCVSVGTLLLDYLSRTDMQADENTLIRPEETT